MPATSLNLLLGRVLIAAAWSDGRLGEDERTSLRDLLFRLPDLTVDEWQALEQQVDVPVSADERHQRVAALHEAATGAQEQDRVRTAVETLLAGDTGFSAEDRAALESVLNEFESPGLLQRLGGLLQEPLRRRARSLAGYFHGQRAFEADVRGRIQEAVRQRMPEHGRLHELDEDRFHKLCLAGGLLARVAHVDDVVTKGEYSEITDALQHGWNLSLTGAALVAEIALSEVSSGLDTYDLVREFFRCTTERERIDFLDVLFRVAEADGHVSREEIESIRLISKGFLLSHHHFIAAKTRVPPQRRDA